MSLMQAYNYFVKYPLDHISIKITIVLCLLVDTLSVAAHYGGVYLDSHVSHKGQSVFVTEQGWPVANTGHRYGFPRAKSCLMLRYWRATKNYFASPLLSLMSITALVGRLVTLVLIVHFSTYAERDHLVVPLVWQLRAMQTAFKDTQSIIHRLNRNSLQTGTLTSILATLVLVTYLTDKESNVTVGRGYCLGRVYTLTLLHNLNTRPRAPTHDSSGAPGTANINHNGPGSESLGGTRFSCLDVHPTAIVRRRRTRPRSWPMYLPSFLSRVKAPE
ncbi:hypothetical protein DFH07DRAFT_781288 [Mycena maculata]|uniref:DUF6534 domain-containing protein n=1 Tax=Mycena maculata TaxID=230809 RepID=A0AAD7MTD6_9AGAR|nr:hypothetical protein DFH07DRAFT_781288 [Mycena maculata]